MAQQGFVNVLGSPLRLRMNENDMQGLNSAGILLLGDDQVQTPKTSSVIMTGNRVETKLPQYNRFYFDSATTITSVSLCVVTSNMFLNDSSGEFTDFGPISFCLDDSAGSPQPPLLPTSPPQQIMVSANLLQGKALIQPVRSATANTSSWEFLNAQKYI